MFGYSDSGQLSTDFMDLQSGVGQRQKRSGNVVLLGMAYYVSKNVVSFGGVVLLW